MEPRERITRMEADGVITPDQAEKLHDSLRPPAGGDEAGSQRPNRRRWPGWIPWAAFALLGVGLVIVLTTGGADQTTVQDVTQSLNQPGGHGEMNRTFSTLLAVALLLVVPILIWTWLHNSLVAKEEKVFESWAQTESNFQRRADLIPALVETVSRYLRHESETLTAVTNERSEAVKRITGAMDELIQAQQKAAEIQREKGAAVVEDETALSQLYAAQTALGWNMSNLFAVAETYPELRSADQFLELQAQLEGTENRINVARMRFNDAVGDYNATMRMMPWSLVAGLGSFQRKAYFRSEEEARSAPDIKIN